MVRRQELLGAWHLRSLEGRSAAGAVNRFAGDGPAGLLIYDPDGYVSMIYMRRGRPRFAADDPGGGTPEEILAAFGGFDAYAGTYTLDEAANSVTHHLLASRFPNWEGTDQVRRVELSGDQLRLTTPPILVAGTEWVGVLDWERARPATRPATDGGRAT